MPVKGAKRSIICDLQKNGFISVPIDYFKTIKKRVIKLSAFDDQEFITKLVELDYGFYTDSPDSFPELDLNCNDIPTRMDNAIIDFNSSTNHEISDIVCELDKLLCSAVELRFFDKIELEKLESILVEFCESTIRTIHIVLKFSEWVTEKILKEITLKFKRVKQIIVHSSKKDEVLNVNLTTIVIFNMVVVADHTSCGNISPHYFGCNVDFFKKALVSNSCLEGKVGIDVNGNIKNCPSQIANYGNIKKDKISEVVTQPNYLNQGKIKKDDIEVCRDCEYRYICLDCRAYTVEGKSNSKPSKCNYNPYTGIWE